MEETADYLARGDPLAPREVLLNEAGFLTRHGPDGGLYWKSHQSSGLARQTPADIEARWQILRSIQCPTLIVRGDQSLVFEEAVAVEMPRVMAQAKLIEIPGAGHYVHRDNPDPFEEAVLGFLGY